MTTLSLPDLEKLNGGLVSKVEKDQEPGKGHQREGNLKAMSRQ